MGTRPRPSTVQVPLLAMDPLERACLTTTIQPAQSLINANANYTAETAGQPLMVPAPELYPSGWVLPRARASRLITSRQPPHPTSSLMEKPLWDPLYLIRMIKTKAPPKDLRCTCPRFRRTHLGYKMMLSYHAARSFIENCVLCN